VASTLGGGAPLPFRAPASAAPAISSPANIHVRIPTSTVAA
jgi:hypothetical protein